MNQQELIETIKKEKLYKWADFQIGPPNDLENIGTFTHTAPAYGICEETPGMWRAYFLSERGTPNYNEDVLTEEQAYELLLTTLRIKKRARRFDMGAILNSDYHIQNREKWFD